MSSAAFLTLGCKVNAYETNGMEKLFREAGFEIKDFQEKADVYVVNTCTVTNMADRKSRQMLHKAKKNNPDSIIVAAGCYVQASYEELEKSGIADLIIGNNQKSRIASIVTEFLEERKRNGDRQQTVYREDGREFCCFEETEIEDAGEKTRAYIKVQDGCNQFCSYCIIPYVRGRIRSRGEEEIQEEIGVLVKKGYKEVVITGIHLSSYGVDFYGEQNFVKLEGRPLLSLLKKVNEIPGIERIRLGSLEPRIITEEMAKGLSEISRLCPHFHLSLQSGCDETLKRMNRKYTTEQFEKGCRILRKYFDNPAITTDIIAGFPQESEEEFEKTKRFVENIAFSDVHIFKYSRRKGTVADRMEGQVAEQVKAARSGELIGLGQKLTRSYMAGFIGKEEKMLAEETVVIDGRTYVTGHNERYLKLAVLQEDGQDFQNQMIPVKVEGELKEGILLCQIML